MDLSRLARLVVRRWYLALVGVALTVGLCSLAAMSVAPVYEAKVDIVLLPAVKSVGDGGNPYLGLNGLEQAGGVLAKRMTDDTMTAKAKQAGADSPYTVEPDLTSTAPMLLITTKGKTADSALKSLDVIVKMAGPTMRSLQQTRGAIRVDDKYLITTQQVTTVQKATAIRTTQTRAVIAAGAVGVIMTQLGIALISRFLDRRPKIMTRASSNAGPSRTRIWQKPMKESVPSRSTREQGREAVSTGARKNFPGAS